MKFATIFGGNLAMRMSVWNGSILESLGKESTLSMLWVISNNSCWVLMMSSFDIPPLGSLMKDFIQLLSVLGILGVSVRPCVSLLVYQGDQREQCPGS